MTGPAGLDAVILQAARNAADIQALAERLEEVKTKLSQLGTVLDGVQGRVSDQAVILQSADGLAETVDELIRRFNAIFPPDDPSTGFYTPIQTPRFWLLEGEERDKAIARLRAWVEQVYQPVFGHVASTLPECWEQHPFCLTVLDVASELHSCLYLQPRRNQGLLSGQGELLTRLMPALADLMAKDTAVCGEVHRDRVSGQVAAWRLTRQRLPTCWPGTCPGPR
jgi:hypothetical protein